jgi:hypothetical protein
MVPFGNVNQFNSDWNALRKAHPLEGRIDVLQQILPDRVLGVTDPAGDAVNSSLDCRRSAHQGCLISGLVDDEKDLSLLD